MNKKSVSLVLGSGGARGLAHIGVIRYLLSATIFYPLSFKWTRSH